MKGAIRYTLQREPGDENELSLEFDYFPARSVAPATSYRGALPAEDAEVELTHAYIRQPGTQSGWVDFLGEMTEREIENAELYILENWE